jgi:hypothetical protein
LPAVGSATFWDRWVWPAGGSGGIPGDLVATLIWVVIVGIVGALVWPPARHAIERFVTRHAEGANEELHRKLDHIIAHHPDIPPLPPKDEDK